MAYTQIQFVSYLVSTLPADVQDGIPTYLGLADPALDIAARCELMLRAMRTARANLPPPTPLPTAGKVLKLFMAPELFFRGATGAYQIDVVQSAIMRLQALAEPGEWDDWVFCFGTIVGTAAPRPGETTSRLFNFALIQEGGTAPMGQHGARIVMKELVSGPDDDAGIFTLRGITWATDISLDHLQARLLRSPQQPGEQQVQVQLVPSAGAVVHPDGIIAMRGGYVFHVDGAGQGTDLRTVGGNALLPIGMIDVDDAAITLPDPAPYAVFDAMFAPAPAPDAAPPRSCAVAELYASGPGAIVFFAAEPIPAAAPVAGPRAPLVWPANDAHDATATPKTRLIVARRVGAVSATVE